jgi:glycosyltransferase involved in cell wall biosynthesis
MSTLHDRRLAGAPTALILGRALHAPWNEGARLIGRNMARIASGLLPVEVISLTRAPFGAQPEDEISASHVLTRLPYGVLSDYAALRALAQRLGAVLRERHIVVAHLIGLPLVLAALLHREGARVIAHATLDGHSYLGLTERLRAAAGWRCFDYAVDAHACSSERVRRRLAAEGYPPHKLHTLPPPVDTERFRPGDRARARALLGLPADAFVVGYIGSLSPRRFPAPTVLRALRSAGADIPRLMLAAFAPEATHAYNRAWSADLEREAGAAGVRARVELRDLEDNQKAALYSAADAVLLPFAAPVAVEPPLTLLEAMACGAGVVASPHANRSRIVAHEVNGQLFHSPEGLARALRLLAGLDARWGAELGRAARATVEAGHSFGAAAASVGALWRSLGVQA